MVAKYEERLKIPVFIERLLEFHEQDDQVILGCRIGHRVRVDGEDRGVGKDRVGRVVSMKDLRGNKNPHYRSGIDMEIDWGDGITYNYNNTDCEDLYRPGFQVPPLEQMFYLHSRTKKE